MKKFLLLIAATALAGTTYAQSITFKKDWGQILSVQKAPYVKHLMTQRRHNAPARVTESQTADDIIYSAEGEERSYYRKTTAYFVAAGSVQQARMEGSACNIVLGDENKVYVYNPITQYDTYSYIVGQRDGDTITFHTPQIVDVQYNEDYTESTNIYATKFRKKKLSATTYTFVADSINTDLKYVIKGDSISLVGGDSIMLALANAEGTWGGYGNAGDVLRKFTDTTVEVPADAEELTYAMKCSDGTGKGVSIVFKDNDIYIKGIASAHPDSWVKGNVVGSTITIPSMQYLGLNETYGYYFYLAGAKKKEVYDPSDDVTYIEYELVPNITMTLDEKSRTFKTDLSLLYNAGNGMLSYDAAYDSPEFSPFNDVATTPATPTISTYMEYNEDAGYGGLVFTLPTEDVNGNWINPEKMKYIIYGDDKAYEFTTDLYTGIEENMTEVPYSFTDDLDFVLQDGEHIVFLYEGGYSKMGVQSVYYGGDERTVSPIVYQTSDGIKVKTTAPVSTEFYDLQGRRLNNPTPGLTIMKAIYADGSVKTIKYIAK